MEIKKLNRKEESDLRDVLKNSCSKHLISLLQTIKKFCRKFDTSTSNKKYQGHSQDYVEQL